MVFKVRAGELGLGVPVNRRWSARQRNTSLRKNWERHIDEKGASLSFSQIYKTSSLLPGLTSVKHLGLLGCSALCQEQCMLKLSIYLLNLQARRPFQISSSTLRTNKCHCSWQGHILTVRVYGRLESCQVFNPHQASPHSTPWGGVITVSCLQTKIY